jgi:hypothetical protein
MLNKFPLTPDRIEEIRKTLKNENIQIYLLTELLEILTSKEASSESLAAAKYYKATSVAKLLKEAL